MIREVAATARGAARDHLREKAREGLIDLATLPENLRRLAMAGYASAGLLLAGVLFGELFGRGHAGVTFHDGIRLVRVPVGVLVLAGAGFAAGWAALLAGASRCPRGIFWPLFLLFLLEAFALTGPVAGGWGRALLLLVPAVALAFRGRQRADWAERPALEVACWFGTALLCVILLGLLAPHASVAAEALFGSLLIPFLALLPWFALLGMEVVEAALKLGRWLVRPLRKRLSDRALSRAAVPLLTLLWLAGLAALSGTSGGMLEEVIGLTLLAALPVLLAALLLALARRLTGRAAAILITLHLAFFPLGFGFALSLRGQGFAEWVLATTGLFPPVFLFAALIVYDAFNAGPRFAEGDSRLLPRPARVLLYFGMLLLLLSFALLRLNARVPATGRLDQEVQEILNGWFGAGLVVCGLPYLGWILWKRRGWLAGEEEAPGDR